MSLSCISFDSYIKPQPYGISSLLASVVYLLIPTSNHNSLLLLLSHPAVVYLLIPTSNHNGMKRLLLAALLYIF